ncbi:unnamed protein product [Heterobilharzia americana]|nr:unnamed protein product [Heterobilharzia americana]
MTIIWCVGLIPAFLAIFVKAEIEKSDIIRSYLHDCATFVSNAEEEPDSEYMYHLETLGSLRTKQVNSSNPVTLCGLTMCKEQRLKYTVYEKLKSGGEYTRIYSEEVSKVLDAPKMTNMHVVTTTDNSAVLRWTLQNYRSCKDKELVFFLFGKETIMQLAKGQEIRIPHLSSNEKYSVYAFPNSVDKEIRIFTTPKLELTMK